MATKAKKTAKAGKVMRGGKGAQLPAGFKAIGGMGAPTWDFLKEPVLQGKLISVNSVQSKYTETVIVKGKKKKVPKMQKVAVVERKDGSTASVWESRGTEPLYDVKIGSRVALCFRGFLKIKGRDKPMKDFQVGVM